MQAIMLLIGRWLVAAVFAMSGYNKATVDFATTSKRLADKGFPMSDIVTWLTVALELGCVALLVLGFKTRIGLLLLMAFTLAAALLFHNFWAFEVAQGKYNQASHMLKNFAMIGGMIGLYIAGPGALSIDGARRN